jgi:hydroxymethylpyrimidine/phosphomethylpyrimidine kinase
MTLFIFTGLFIAGSQVGKGMGLVADLITTVNVPF